MAARTFAVFALRNSLPVPVGVGVGYQFVPLLPFTALATVELSLYRTTRHNYGYGQMRAVPASHRP